jgi:acetyl esterase/lipase
VSGVGFDPGAPWDVEEEDTVYARAGARELLARVYRPVGPPAAPLAALVDVHGGAWSRGDHTTGARHARALAASGLVVVSPDFRQGPENRHPAASADVAAAVRWTRAHAGRLGVAPERIGLLGASSGGQLALLAGLAPELALHAGTPIVLPDGRPGPAAGGGRVAVVLALYPVCDPLARYRYVLGREHEPPSPAGFDARRLIAAHRGYFADEAAMARASVTRLVEAGEATERPPVWLAQAGQDDNVPAAITEAFVAAYRRAGGTLEHAHFPASRHGFIQTAGPDLDKAVALVRAFVGRHLA